MTEIFHFLVYNPLYNGLISLISILPHKDVGVAVILFTLIVKLILFPRSKQSLETQVKMRTLEPEMKKLREKYKDNREELARQTMSFYKTNKINPFASFFLILIQLPIIFALYYIFLKSGLPVINNEILYSFVPSPTGVNMEFLELIDISKASIFLGLIAGISQFFQAQFSIPKIEKKQGQSSFGDDLAHSMNIQMRYVFPALIFMISFTVSGAVALYWITGNIFTICQELYIRKQKLRS